MTNPREIKIFYARLLLALAFAVGLLSAFQDWELGQNDFDYTGNAVKRNYATVVRVMGVEQIRFYIAPVMQPIAPESPLRGAAPLAPSTSFSHLLAKKSAFACK